MLSRLLLEGEQSSCVRAGAEENSAANSAYHLEKSCKFGEVFLAVYDLDERSPPNASMRERGGSAVILRRTSLEFSS